MELQYQTKELGDKLNVYILCPGLSKNDLLISFDKKDGVLEIKGTPEKSDVSEIIDLEISGKITISPKHRSETVKAIVSNGVAVIELGLSKDVKLIEAE